jgi:hypothetical protein
MTALKDFFAKPPVPETTAAIIKWWESRRLYYNAIIFAEILFILVLFTCLGLRRRAKFNPIKMPAGGLSIAMLCLQLPANIWYTGGWIAEVFLRHLWPGMSPGFGPWALRLGIGFSILFVGYFMSFFAMFTQ